LGAADFSDLPFAWGAAEMADAALVLAAEAVLLMFIYLGDQTGFINQTRQKSGCRIH